MPLIVPPKLRRRVQRRRGRPPLRVLRSGAIPGPVTFPTTNLAFRVMVALSADLSASATWWQWDWVDITDYVRQDLGISIRTGCPPGYDRVTPGSLVLKLGNTDGRFSRRNPNSPYYGRLSKNTPIWVQVDAGSGWKTIFQVFVNEWPVRWSDKSGTDSTVTIQCAGILRRLGQGSAPKSALRRTILAEGTASYWWPLEDGTDALCAGSGLAGGLPLIATDGPGFDAAGPDGSAAAVDLSAGGKLRSPTLTGISDDAWCVSFFGRSDDVSSTETYLSIWLGSGAAWSVVAIRPQPTINAGPSVYAIQPDGTLNSSNTPRPDDPTGWHLIQLVGETNGANAVLQLYVDGVTNGSDGRISIAGEMRAPTLILVNSATPGLAFTATPGAICHLVVHSGVTTPPEWTDAMGGYVGETATARIVRLCAQAGIPLHFTGETTAGVAMGPQGVDTFLALLRQGEAVDGAGRLYEPAEGFALGYLSHRERENTPVVLALDFELGHIAELPTPADDDQRTRNRWTVSRPGGSEYTHEITTGPMGTGTEGPGVYDDSTTANVETDEALIYQASYRTMLGTVDLDRWPRVDLDFARNPTLLDAFTAMGFGARATLSNPPPEMPPDTIDLTVEGVSQRLDARSWRASLNAIPFEPNRTFRTAEDAGDSDEFLGYLIPDTCVTCEELDTTETSVLFFSEPRFSFDDDDWTPPALMVIGGETVALSAVDPVASDTFTRTESATWGTMDTGQTWVTNQVAADWDVI